MSEGKRVSSVSFPPEGCNPSIPLDSFSYWLCWRGPLWCVLRLLRCCQGVGQSVLGRLLMLAPFPQVGGRELPWLGLLMPGDKFCALWWQRWAFLWFEKWHVSSSPQYSCLDTSCTKAVEEHTGKCATLHRDLNWICDCWVHFIFCAFWLFK